MPTAAWTSSCARMAAICAGIASGAWARVGTDEDFKMAVRAKSVIPALADRLALAARAGEADGRADTRGQGGASSASNKGAMPAATRLSQLSRLPCVIVLLPSNRLSGDGHAIGRNTDAQERRRERGAAGFDGGGAAAAQRGTAPSNPVAGERRPGPPFPLQTGSTPAHAGTMKRDPLAISPPPCGSSPWAKTACGLGERSE